VQVVWPPATGAYEQRGMDLRIKNGNAFAIALPFRSICRLLVILAVLVLSVAHSSMTTKIFARWQNAREFCSRMHRRSTLKPLESICRLI
jgi:hypothetical protein